MDSSTYSAMAARAGIAVRRRAGGVDFRARFAGRLASARGRFVMKIALFGNGAMGSRVRALAEEEGHEIGLVVASWAGDYGMGGILNAMDGHDVAIDFSTPEAVLRNVEVCAIAGVPLVEGTTGWDEYFYAVREIVNDLDGSFVFGSDFSSGVDIPVRLVERASEIFAVLDEYCPGRGADLPADTLARLGLSGALRADDRHAFGALLAARWIAGRRGFFPFAEIVNDILGARTAPAWRTFPTRERALSSSSRTHARR
jgi:hypothetical protein